MEVDDWILTYRMFMTPRRMLAMLMHRFNTTKQTDSNEVEKWSAFSLIPILRILSVLGFMKIWIEYFDDFSADPLVPTLATQWLYFIQESVLSEELKILIEDKKVLRMKFHNKALTLLEKAKTNRNLCKANIA